MTLNNLINAVGTRAAAKLLVLRSKVRDEPEQHSFEPGLQPFYITDIIQDCACVDCLGIVNEYD